MVRAIGLTLMPDTATTKNVKPILTETLSSVKRHVAASGFVCRSGLDLLAWHFSFSAGWFFTMLLGFDVCSFGGLLLGSSGEVPVRL